MSRPYMLGTLAALQDEPVYRPRQISGRHAPRLAAALDVQLFCTQRASCGVCFRYKCKACSRKLPWCFGGADDERCDDCVVAESQAPKPGAG